MKKRFISFALVCILLLIFPACSSKQNNDYGGDPMEFKSFKNIESSFRQIRLFTLVFLGICASLTTYAI